MRIPNRSLALALGLLVGLSGCGYNTIQAADEAVKAAWGEVQNQYQRRMDLIPNLVATVKGAADFEKETLEAVIQARASATQVKMDASVINDPEAFKKIQESQGQLGAALGDVLMVVSERYPELKATAAFRDLQAQLEGTENRITVARKRYVDAGRRVQQAGALVPDEPDGAVPAARGGAPELRGDGRRREAARGEVLSARRALAVLAALCLALAGDAHALEVPRAARRASIDRALAARRPRRGARSSSRSPSSSATTGHQIVVHVTPSLEGMPIEDYSMQVAEAWRIGQKGLDNGVILTVAPNERELRIEVGYGLEGVLPDAITARIIREQITPAFREGDMDGGVRRRRTRDHGGGQGRVPAAPGAAAGAEAGLPALVRARLLSAAARDAVVAAGSARSSGLGRWTSRSLSRGRALSPGTVGRRLRRWRRVRWRRLRRRRLLGRRRRLRRRRRLGALVMRVKELLDPAAFAAIEAAVRDAERCTSGEIVPLLAERSDDYAEVRFVAAFAAGARRRRALARAGARPPAPGSCRHSSAYSRSPRGCAGRRALLRWLAPHAWLVERVHRAAELAFHQLGIVETRDRTGILIYVSLLERRVVVLADRGIHARVADGTWDGVVARIVEGIRRGEADDGLAEGIRLCGEILRAARSAAAERPERATGPPARPLTPSSDTSGTPRTGCAGAE